MAVFRGASGSNVDFNSAAALSSITWPTGTVNGDTVFWALIFNPASGASPVNVTSTPSGWTTVVNVAHGTYRLLVMRHTYATGETTSSYTVTTDDTTGGLAYMTAIAYSGVFSVGAPTTNTGASGNSSVASGGARGTGLYLAILANEAGVSSIPGSGTERLDFSGNVTLTAIEQGALTAPTNVTNTWSSTTAGWMGAVIPLDVGGVALGATLSGVTFPLRHAGLGPYRSSAGNEYFFGRDSVNTGTVEPHKATDPMSAFTAQTAKLMSSGTTTAIEAVSCYPVGDVIHIVTQISTGQVFYNSFNMGTDAWTLTTSETAAAAASFAPSAGYSFVSLVVRSGGEVVVGYCAGLTAMSSGFHMVRYIRRTGTNTWTGATNVDGGGSVDWGYGFAVLGASDRVHFLFQRLTATSLVHQRTLSSANALETLGAGFGIGLSVAQTWPVSYVDSGTTRVRALAVYNATENLTSFDSADAPALSQATGISDRGPRNTSQQDIHVLANDGTTLHMLYADSTDSDLYHDTSAGGGGAWSTDVEEWDAATINRISANVYDRSGTKLAIVVDDGGTIKYAEIALAAATVEQVIHRSRSGYTYY